MITFLFWNLNRKDLSQNIASLAQFHDVDIFIFAEFDLSIPNLLKLLNKSQSSYYYHHNNCDKIKIFTRYLDRFIQPISEADRFTINRLKLPGIDEILVVATHFVDKRNWDEDSQNAECINLASRIREAEKSVGHNRTILVGDLNMNPFQAGVIMANGLHAVMTKKIAAEMSRKVQETDYQFFYNPMWNLLGDHSSGLPGTYFLRQSVHKVYFWNILDQALVRPDLLDAFDVNNLAILESDGQVSFLNKKGYPDQRNYSDHLPIKFTLNL